MARASRSQSFHPDGSRTVVLPTGQIAHREHAEQSALLEKKFYAVRPGVWCFVGNGLSNQSFVEGPEGIIAIDTGESVEEMASALRELRAHTAAPIAAVLYTHFHYVAGTRAVLDEAAGREVPVYGHAKIGANRLRAATEIAPAYGRGVVEQFGLALPLTGPDGLVNVGLGFHFRNPEHAPFTPGYVPPTNVFHEPCEIRAAGLTVRVTPAPSDADDSVTFWFPELATAVNNLVWPTLFNIFAIRGEEYRDPRVLLAGLDHLLSLRAEHLVGTHGPPLRGRSEIHERVTRYRDAIQFIWDQTVRGANRGLTSAELAHEVALPATCGADPLTRQLYGVTEHHARQIRSGLFGFFDGDPANLFPLPPDERASRLITGFGGRESVREQSRTALARDDLRWAIETASWLVASPGADSRDRELLAEALRKVAQRTTAANIRSWCLTRARVLEGEVDGDRFRVHRFHRSQILASPPELSVRVLRVMLDPDPAVGLDVHIGWNFDGCRTGLHLRNCIACPTDGADAEIEIRCTLGDWADVLTGQVTLSAALESQRLGVRGDRERLRTALACFDLESLKS